MMRRHQLKPGKEVRVRGNDYMRCRVKQILPVGSHGRSCVLVECECSNDGDWRFGLIKTFRMVDLVPVPSAASSEANGTQSQETK